MSPRLILTTIMAMGQLFASSQIPAHQLAHQSTQTPVDSITADFIANIPPIMDTSSASARNPFSTFKTDSTTAIPTYTSAIASIRLKKYALGLKLFFQSLAANIDYRAIRQINVTGTDQQIQIDSLLLAQSGTDQDESDAPDSKKFSARQILRAFKDGKKAIAYGILIHIKQPVPGTRRTFKWFDGVGHSFLTLTKYNQDSSMVSRTFGYYPDKRFILQGTPILPAALSIYKNDRLHEVDETIGKLITARQFRKILRITRRFGAKKYHLNKNNCTDFVLKVASVAGFQIQGTKGSWPLGGGNDPGDLGQSILENKISCDCGNNYLIYASPKSTAKMLSPVSHLQQIEGGGNNAQLQYPKVPTRPLKP